MADSQQDSVSVLLEEWGLGEYTKVFIDEKVDEETLSILNDGDLRQMIPRAGDRARFRKKLATWRTKQSEPTLSQVIEVTNAHEQNRNESIDAVVNIRNVGEISNDNILNLFEHVEDTFETILNPTNLSDVSSSSSVLKLLETTVDGKAILNSGKINGLLEPTLRSRLARLIATQELTNNPTGIVTASRFMECAQEIQKIFPKESADIYYIPYRGATPQQPKRNASGKLYDAVVNRRRDLRKRGVLTGSVLSLRSTSDQSSSTASVSSVPELPSLEDQGDGSELQEKLLWLNSSVDPWHLVQANWNATTRVRLAALEEKGTVEEYFNLYPALKQPDGYRLLLEDFEYMYKENKDYLYSNTVLYQKQIVEVARRRIGQLKDKDVKREITEIIDSITDDRPDSETNAALLLLPYLTPSIASKKKGKPTWKPSRSEIRSGFISQIADAGDLEAHLTARRKKLCSLQRTFQPLVVYAGKKDIYVVVAQTAYKLNSLLQAVDVAFKVTQATKAEYSDESYIVWLFVQRVLYQINTKFDRSISVLNNLISDLKL